MKKEKEEILEFILAEIKKNPKITQREMAEKLYYSVRQTRRYMKVLIDRGKIKFVRDSGTYCWVIL